MCIIRFLGGVYWCHYTLHLLTGLWFVFLLLQGRLIEVKKTVRTNKCLRETLKTIDKSCIIIISLNIMNNNSVADNMSEIWQHFCCLKWLFFKLLHGVHEHILPKFKYKYTIRISCFINQMLWYPRIIIYICIPLGFLLLKTLGSTPYVSEQHEGIKLPF